jgi:hypothetical protein
MLQIHVTMLDIVLRFKPVNVDIDDHAAWHSCESLVGDSIKHDPHSQQFQVLFELNKDIHHTANISYASIWCIEISSDLHMVIFSLRELEKVLFPSANIVF